MKNHIKLELDAKAKNVALARSTAAAFIATEDPTLEMIADIRTAVSEAVTNAVVHAYSDEIGVVIMDCSLENGLLTICVSDSGCGIADIAQAMQPFFTTGEEGERTGMGFAVMNAFMDSLEVESAVGKGTVVKMKKRIRSNE